MHPCMCIRRYIHVYTPTNGRPVREVSLVSIGKQYNTWQTHTRAFHLTDPYEGFLSVLLPRSETPSCQQCTPIWTHAYIHTTHASIYASWLDVLVYGGGKRRQREGKLEIGNRDDWLITTYICTLYYPPRFHPTFVFGAKTPTTTVGGTHDPSHSVLLPSEPIKRPGQHSVTIQATPTLFAFRRGKGSTGGRGGRVGVYRCILFKL